MVFGPMIRQTVLEYINMLTALNMKENGKMTYNMERELKHGLMVQNMKEIMLTEENME